MKTVVLSGPGKNSLSTALMERTLAEVRDAGGAPILLTGEGDAFSAGLNLKEVASLERGPMERFLTTLEELVCALYEYPGPIVAWVNGHAIAGGCVLALTADLRIVTAEPKTRIGLNEVALGLRFPPLTLAMVRARVPSHAIERVVLEAGLHAPEAAVSLGLVDEIGDEAKARAALERLGSYPRDVYAWTKKKLRGRLEIPQEEARRFREETIAEWASPELRAKMLAALKK